MPHYSRSGILSEQTARRIFEVAAIKDEDLAFEDIQVAQRLGQLLIENEAATLEDLTTDESDPAWWFAFLANQLAETDADEEQIEKVSIDVGYLVNIKGVDLNTALYSVYAEA